MLNNLQRRYDLLVREHGRMEQQHKKSRDHPEEARTDQGRLEDEVKRGRGGTGRPPEGRPGQPRRGGHRTGRQGRQRKGQGRERLEKARDTEVDQRRRPSSWSGT